MSFTAPSEITQIGPAENNLSDEVGWHFASGLLDRFLRSRVASLAGAGISGIKILDQIVLLTPFQSLRKYYLAIPGACSTLMDSVTVRFTAAIESFLATLRTHYLYLLDSGTAGPVNLEVELKRLDSASALLSAKHKAMFFDASCSAFMRQLFADFRFLSEDLHQPLNLLYSLHVAFTTELKIAVVVRIIRWFVISGFDGPPRTPPHKLYSDIVCITDFVLCWQGFFRTTL